MSVPKVSKYKVFMKNKRRQGNNNKCERKFPAT